MYGYVGIFLCRVAELLRLIAVFTRISTATNNCCMGQHRPRIRSALDPEQGGVGGRGAISCKTLESNQRSFEALAPSYTELFDVYWDTDVDMYILNLALVVVAIIFGEKENSQLLKRDLVFLTEFLINLLRTSAALKFALHQELDSFSCNYGMV